MARTFPSFPLRQDFDGDFAVQGAFSFLGAGKENAKGDQSHADVVSGFDFFWPFSHCFFNLMEHFSANLATIDGRGKFAFPLRNGDHLGSRR